MDGNHCSKEKKTYKLPNLEQEYQLDIQLPWLFRFLSVLNFKDMYSPVITWYAQ
jgi:hypothetical protein